MNIMLAHTQPRERNGRNEKEIEKERGTHLPSTNQLQLQLPRRRNPTSIKLLPHGNNISDERYDGVDLDQFLDHETVGVGFEC